MTIRKGLEWGHQGVVPENRRIVQNDRELATSVGCVVSVVGGDVHRALGCPPAPPIGGTCVQLTMDLLECSVVGRHRTLRVNAASSVVVGRWLSRRRLICVTNPGWWNGRNVAPRAHPNDGVVDIVVFAPRMPLVQRIMARGRARHGVHVPHPSVTTSRVTEWTGQRAHRSEVLRIDGRRIRGWDSVSVRVDADSLTLQV